MDLETLTKMVSEKTGIGEDKAEMAVRMVLGQVKEKLPAPAQGYIDQMLGSDTPEGTLKNAISSGLGSLMGG